MVIISFLLHYVTLFTKKKPFEIKKITRKWYDDCNESSTGLYIKVKKTQQLDLRLFNTDFKTVRFNYKYKNDEKRDILIKRTQIIHLYNE